MLKLDPKNHERVTAWERKERHPGDYGPPQQVGLNKGFSSREEELEYLDELLTVEEQINY